MSDGIVRALRAATGEDAVVTDPGVLATHEVDWTGRFRGKAVALVRPGSAAEVGEALRACAAAGVGVVPQGGNTGLVAGAVPHGEVVLSTARLDQLGDVDRQGSEVTAGAGVTLQRLQHAAAAAGLAFGVDLAARGSATVGGLIATDAGGIHAVRYGSMRRQVLELEAVLPDGRVVSELPQGSARADRDLVTVLTGSEGTLAVLTEARLRLVPVLAYRAAALLAFDTVADAADATTHFMAQLPDLEAAELMDRAALGVAAERSGAVPAIGGAGPVLLVEVAGDEPRLDALASALDGVSGLDDAFVADDGPGRRRLWALREGITDAIAATGVPHKLDVRLPLERVADFIEALRPTVAIIDRESRVFVFGHLGVGNLHVNVVGLPSEDDRVDDAVLRLVAAHGGSIAGEHGVGRAKARWLRLARSAEELSAHAALKRALDPEGILNPGVLDAGA